MADNNVIMFGGVAFSSTPSSASAVPYSNTTSSLAASNVQAAIDEVVAGSMMYKVGTNCNTALTTGVYVSGAWTNGPSLYGTLKVVSYGGYISQEFIDVYTNRVFVRTSSNSGSTFSSWAPSVMKAYVGVVATGSLPVNTQTNVTVTLPASYNSIAAIIPWGYSPSGTYATPLYFRGTDISGIIYVYPAGSNVQTYSINYTILYY